jgi:hypothetical protein
MNSKGYEAIAAALRALADAVGSMGAPSPSSEASDVPRYYTRSTAPIEARAWDRAVRALPAFRPGREKMILRSDLHAWIESFVAAPKKVAATRVMEGDDTPIDYEEFASRARRQRSRRLVKCQRCSRDFLATVRGKPFGHKCLAVR